MAFDLGGLVASIFNKGVESNPGFGIKATGDVPYDVTDPEEWMKKHPANEPAMRPSWSKRYFEPEAARAQEYANFNYSMQPALAAQEEAAKVSQLKALTGAQQAITHAAFAEKWKNTPDSLKPLADAEIGPIPRRLMNAAEGEAIQFAGTPTELLAHTRSLEDISNGIPRMASSAIARRLTTGNDNGLPEAAAFADLSDERGRSRDQSAKDRQDRINRTIYGDNFRAARNTAHAAMTDAQKIAYLATQGKESWSTLANTQKLNAQKENLLAGVVPLGDGARIATLNKDGTLSIEDNPTGYQHGRQNPLSMLGGIDGLNMQTGLPGLIPSVSGVNKAIDLGSREFIPPMRLRAFGAPPPEKLRQPTTASKVEDNTDNITQFIPEGLKKEAAEAKSEALNEKTIAFDKEVLSIKKRLKELENPMRPVYAYSGDSNEPLTFENWSAEELKKSQPKRLAEAAKLAARLAELHKTHNASGH